MEPQNSILVIEDIVLMDSHETQLNAEMDILMMLLFGGRERTSKHWQELLMSVSPPLEIINVWRAHNEFQAVIEAKRKAQY